MHFGGTPCELIMPMRVISGLKKGHKMVLIYYDAKISRK